MHSRIIGLTFEVPSLSVFNVWDLPLWAWRSYAVTYDALCAEREREASRG